MRFIGKLISVLFNLAADFGGWLDRRLLSPMSEGFNEAEGKRK